MLARPVAPTGLPPGVLIPAAPGGHSALDPEHPSHALDVAPAAVENFIFHLLLHFKRIGGNSRTFYA